MKVYRGAPAAARNYLDADRSRADDYYLVEGTGIARRFTVGPDGPVTELVPLVGDGSEGWVAGLDPNTGQPRGRVRTDAHAVRFVEVTVNGPKSWSLALDQSALLELLDVLKGSEVDDRIRQAATTIYQSLIEAELTAVALNGEG